MNKILFTAGVLITLASCEKEQYTDCYKVSTRLQNEYNDGVKYYDSLASNGVISYQMAERHKETLKTQTIESKEYLDCN